MWNLKTLKIVNLLSHENTVHVFKANAMTMFVGKNGSGKSGINEGIAIAFTGDVTRGIGRDEYIKTGEDSCMVDLLMTNNVLNKKIRIVRNIYLKKTATLDIFVDGVKKQFATVNDGNAYIFSEIGFDKEDFLNYFLISQSNNNSFFSSSDTKQKEIISRFSNYKPIDAIIEKLKKEEMRYTYQIVELENEKGKIDAKIGVYNERINEINENFEANKIEVVTGLISQKVSYQQTLVDIKKEAKRLLESMEDRRAKLTGIKIVNGEKISANLKLLKKQLTEHQSNKREANELQGNLNSQLGGKVVCPSCKHEFIVDSKMEVAEIEETLQLIKNELKDVDLEIVEIENAMQSKRNKLADINKNIELKAELEEEIDEILKRVEAIERQKITYMGKLHAIDDKITAEEAKTPDEEIATVRAKINELRNARYEEIDAETTELDTKIADCKFHQLHFSNKGFKSFLARKSIKNIQDICNWYLTKFNIDLQVSISGYTTLKSGDIRDKIDVTIIRSGYERGAFKKHSGGEKNRVDLCGLLTLNKLVNNSVDYGKGLNLLVVDEYVGYLDGEGKYEIIDILSNSGITSILVMHEVGKIQYENKLFFTKVGGTTKITKDEQA